LPGFAADFTGGRTSNIAANRSTLCCEISDTKVQKGKTTVGLNETIPLFFLSLCCFGLIPVAGFSGLAFILFVRKDRLLARNILITISIAVMIPVVYIGYETLFSIFLVLFSCAEQSLSITEIIGEILILSQSLMLKVVYFSLTPGFLIAFGWCSRSRFGS
jgi:hypothetical protein